MAECATMRIVPLGLLLCACAGAPAATPQTVPAEPPRPTAAEAKAFIDKVNPELRARQIKSSTAEWIKNTYLTDDTERSAAQANEASLAYQTAAVKEAARFKDVPGLDPMPLSPAHQIRAFLPWVATVRLRG